MPGRSVSLRRDDMIEAAEPVRVVLGDVSLDELEADWQRQWLVQRGIEIISEASRHLPDDVKARHPESSRTNPRPPHGTAVCLRRCYQVGSSQLAM